jgi:pantoate--beta-alanine ligase
MRTFLTSSELQAAIRGPRANGESVALVPTMGHLHAGHLSLVKLAKQRADRVIVSIFVNPMQFNQSTDLDNYPLTPQEDALALEQAGVDWLFTPEAEEIYPEGIAAATQIKVPRISEPLEGVFRPGHFSGVATVVAKLLNIVSPDLVVFGDKDFQQLQVIRKMVADLSFGTRVISGETIREADGLAMSSRNTLLTENDRRRAPKLYRLLFRISELLQTGARNYTKLESQSIDLLNKAGFNPDYVSVRNALSLEPAGAGDTEVVILAAASLGSVRLIDNVPVALQAAIEEEIA